MQFTVFNLQFLTIFLVLSVFALKNDDGIVKMSAAEYFCFLQLMSCVHFCTKPGLLYNTVFKKDDANLQGNV